LGVPQGTLTQALRSSSARALRCTVQSANERNPHLVLFFQNDFFLFLLKTGEKYTQGKLIEHINSFLKKISFQVNRFT